MSELDSIKLLIGIKEENISIQQIIEEKEEHETVLIVKATLSKSLRHCPNCHSKAKESSQYTLVRNGSKTSRITLNKSANQKTILSLKKQRYHCRACQKYCTLFTSLVKPHCFISVNVRNHVLEELTEKQSMKLIAKHTSVSWSTVERTLTSLKPYVAVRKDWLPSCLLFDEFRSLKTQEGKFSFSFMDGTSGKLIDILPSRRKKFLIQYFMTFTKEAREKVRYIVTDMNAPYFSVVKECFPNATPVIDRFHIVQHINRFFDQIRKRVMKSLDQKNSEEAKQYRQLKSLFKLLLKEEDKLDYQCFYPWRNFHWRLLTETDVIDRLLSISEELSVAYRYFQQLLHAFHQKDGHLFFDLLDQMPADVPRELHHIKKAFSKYRQGISTALEVSFSNGKLENLHTHIKNLKRHAYGFRNFQNMRLRIFLLNNLIDFK